MCGFLGYLGGNVSTREALAENLARIDYRGPDYTGILEVDDLWLGHNRLSIIDLASASNQPMLSHCGRVVLVFNGEIYNYDELKKSLPNYPFITLSDTEVILAAYLEWGEDFLAKLEGMFSIALYDRERESVLLARDQIGKKPLYYSCSQGTLAFASEVKALKGLPGLSFELDDVAVNEYFSSGVIGVGRSLYKEVSQVPAGHSVKFSTVNLSAPERNRYWQLAVDVSPKSVSEDDLLDEFDSLLRRAVKLRMRSDVPLGAFLSGGLDSSLIVALMAELSSEPINTFTISFGGTSSDEERYAARIASHFGTRHFVHNVDEDFLALLPGLIAQLDMPFADSSFIPTYFVCQQAKKHVTVCLSGDGGDELFAGYGHYDYFAFEDRVRKNWPGSLRKMLGYVASILPDRHRTNSVKRLIFDDPYDAMTAHSSRFFNYEERKSLLNGIRAVPDPEEEFRSRFLPGIDWQQNICQADFQDYLVDDILVKVDRMSMLNSLEVRSPLLDKGIAEFAFSKVPSNMKRNGSVKKYLLKQLARRYLLDDFEYERKHGFGVPLGQWFNGSLGDRFFEKIHDSSSGYIDKDVALKYLKLHRRGFSNYSKRLFAILVWEEWFAMQ